MRSSPALCSPSWSAGSPASRTLSAVMSAGSPATTVSRPAWKTRSMSSRSVTELSPPIMGEAL